MHSQISYLRQLATLDLDLPHDDSLFVNKVKPYLLFTSTTPANDTASANKGLMTRCIQKMFSKLKGSEKVRFQYVQLYNKDWLDLLNPPTSSGGKGGADIILEETDRFM
jgi:hypothetical protein